MNRQNDYSIARAPEIVDESAPAQKVDNGWYCPVSMRRWILAVFDQGVVSGTRFLSTIVIGRVAGPDELGHYSIAFSALILLGCFQEAVVSTPYAVHFHRLGVRSRTSYAGGSLLLHWLIATCSGLAFLAFAAIGALGFAQPAWTQMALVVAVTIPFSLMWEFSRRSLLAQLDMAAALRVDLTAATLQILGLACLAITGELTAVSAMLVVAFGTLSAGLIWLYRSRSTRMLRWQWFGKYWRRNWRLGKWLVAGQLMGALHSLAPFLMLAMLATAAETGVFAAYFNIALVANPLILAMGNLLTARTAQAFNREGSQAVSRSIRNAVLGITGILTIFVGTLILCGDRIVSAVYGSQYVGHSTMLVILGICPMVWAVSVACACGLAALRYPRGSFIASLVGTTISAIAIFVAIPIWSVMGAACGLLIGGAVAALLHVVIFIGRCRSMGMDSRLKPREVAQLELQESFS